jgi:hypothetical protein
MFTVMFFMVSSLLMIVRETGDIICNESGRLRSVPDGRFGMGHGAATKEMPQGLTPFSEGRRIAGDKSPAYRPPIRPWSQTTFYPIEGAGEGDPNCRQRIHSGSCQPLSPFRQRKDTPVVNPTAVKWLFSIPGPQKRGTEATLGVVCKSH